MLLHHTLVIQFLRRRRIYIKLRGRGGSAVGVGFEETFYNDLVYCIYIEGVMRICPKPRATRTSIHPCKLKPGMKGACSSSSVPSNFLPCFRSS